MKLTKMKSFSQQVDDKVNEGIDTAIGGILAAFMTLLKLTKKSKVRKEDINSVIRDHGGNDLTELDEETLDALYNELKSQDLTEED